jgi:hypothetical protein
LAEAQENEAKAVAGMKMHREAREDADIKCKKLEVVNEELVLKVTRLEERSLK